MVRISFFLAVMLIFFTGCAERVLYPRFEQSIWSSYFQMQDIKPGMTKQEVIGKMGPPKVVEQGDKGYTFLFYQTHNMDKEGNETIRGGLTPLVFKNDRLEGMGARAYNRAMSFPNRDAATMPYVLPR